MTVGTIHTAVQQWHRYSHRLARHYWQWHLGVLFTPLIITAIVIGWNQSLTAWPNNIDPGVFVKRASVIAETGRLITPGQVSPPLRYLPLATLYWLFDPTPVMAERLASLHAAFFSFVILPASIYVFARTVYTTRVAIGIVIAFILLRSIGFQSFGYYLGSWQYDLAAPFVFGALAATHASITSDSSVASRRYAIAAGVAIGLAGLIEFALAGVAALVVAAAYLSHLDWRGVTTTGVVGAAFTPGLLLLPSKANGHLSAYLAKRVIPGPRNKWAVRGFWASPRDNAVLTLVALVLTGVVYTERRLSKSLIPEFALVLYLAVWYVGNVTATYYILAISQKFGPYVLIASAIAVAGRIFHKRGVHLPTVSRTSMGLVRVGTTVVLTALLLVAVPEHVGTNPMRGSLI